MFLRTGLRHIHGPSGIHDVILNPRRAPVSFEDKTLVCRDCGNEFTFTAGEQEFYEQKGFTNEPQRCRDCRQARKQQRGGPMTTDRPSTSGNYRSEGYARSGNEYGSNRNSGYGSPMRGDEYERSNDYGGSYNNGNDYSRDNNYGGMSRSNEYGNSRYGNEGFARQERVQHETICAQCGRPTTVPFVPRAGRPVYCQECFAQRRGPTVERSPRPDSGYNRF